MHVLGTQVTVARGDSPPQRPYVYRSTAHITRADLRGKRLTLDLEGVGPKHVEFAGLAPERPVEITVYRGPTVFDEPALAADARGHVELTLSGEGRFTVDVGRR